MKSNWSNNITFQPAGLESPVSIEHLQNIVQQNSKVKFIGAGHSFNTIADTDGVLVALDDLPCLMQIHVAESKVSVSGNTKLGVLADYLHSHGYAIPNLPSLPHITVAGAVATGTHGSGITNQPIAGEVAAMRIVTALGDMVQFKAGNDTSFAGKPVHLGMLGFIAELDLRIVPTFEISQTVILDANWQRTLDRSGRLYGRTGKRLFPFIPGQQSPLALRLCRRMYRF